METCSEDNGAKKKEDHAQKKPKCDWYIYCEKCDDLVIDECPKHPYIRDATNDGAEASMPTKSRRDAAKLRRTLIETAKGINDPQIVSFSSVGDAGAQDNFEDTEAMLKDEDQHDEDDQQSDEDEMANNLESSNVRLVPAAHCETTVARMTDEEYYKSVVYIPCKKQIRVDEHGNEVLVYDVKQADGTVLQNFYMSPADDYELAIEPVTRDELTQPSGFRIPQNYPGPLKRVRRKHPVSRLEPDGHPIFACNFCGKRLTQSSSLTVHMRIHTGEKPYKCEYCDKSFNHHSNMVKHERVHTGAQPYVCPYCGKSFNQSTHLKTHIFSRAHTRGRFKKEVEEKKEKKSGKPGRKKRRKKQTDLEAESSTVNEELAEIRKSQRQRKKSVKLYHDDYVDEAEAKRETDSDERNDTDNFEFEGMDRVEIKSEVSE